MELTPGRSCSLGKDGRSSRTEPLLTKRLADGLARGDVKGGTDHNFSEFWVFVSEGSRCSDCLSLLHTAHCATNRKNNFAHCAVFCSFLFMDFVEALRPWSVPKIIETLGCPERTVYAWKMGERLPAEWVQRLILERLKHIKPTEPRTQPRAIHRKL